MHLALFDLDHTLLPIDSDCEWSLFLVRIGVLDGEAHERENDRFHREYQAGTLGIAEFLRLQHAPIAGAFGIEHLVATGVERGPDGEYTGRPEGTPSFREGKIRRTGEWLASLGHALEAFERSWFCSDSRNDLPLLERVTDPLATNPDDVLHAAAIERGWPVLRLFEGVAR
jgi:phosphoserine phosphatase